MEKLEKIIINNKESFNNEEPKSGHEKRFEQMLEEQDSKKKSTSLKIIYRVAAVGLVLAVSSFLLIFNDMDKKGLMSLGDISPEYYETENYYKSKIDNKIETLCYSDNNIPESEQNMLCSEINEMEQSYYSLQKELSRNPNNQHIINAMIKHYQTKDKILNEMINEMSNLNK